MTGKSRIAIIITLASLANDDKSHDGGHAHDHKEIHCEKITSKFEMFGATGGTRQVSIEGKARIVK